MYNEELKKLESNIYGLKYIPSLSEGSNSADFIFVQNRQINVNHADGNGQFTKRNYDLALEQFKKLDQQKCIVEIGVAKNFNNSSTEMFLTNKRDNAHYFGIDIVMDGKMHHEEYKPNTHMLLMNSRDDKEKILEKMKQSGCEEIDVLMIDGDHSIDLVLNDWGYAQYVRRGGLIFLHDVAIHPGPNLIFDAIDEKLFHKEKYFCELDNDWGIAVVWKK